MKFLILHHGFGYTMITADDLDHAESIARECPFVDATRVYAIRG